MNSRPVRGEARPSTAPAAASLVDDASSTSDYSRRLFQFVHGPDRELSEIGQARVRWIADRIPGDVRTVLDLGSGTGFLSNLLFERGYRVVGLDLVRASVRRLRGPGIQGDGTRLPFVDGAFDLVVCAETIEHLGPRERERILAEIWRVARGYALLTVPFRERLAEALMRCDRCGFVFHSWGHVASFDERLLRRLLPRPPVLLEAFTREEGGYAAPLLRVRQRVFGTYGWDDPALCPSCGHHDIKPPGRSVPVRLIDRANRLLGIRRRSGWILSLVARGEGSAAGGGPGGAPHWAARPLPGGLALDRAMTRLALAAERRIGERSWRLARGAVSATRAAHEVIRRLGGPVWERAAADITRELQSAPAAAAPSTPSLSPRATAPSTLASALRLGTYDFGAGSIPVASVDWTRHPAAMTSARDQFHFYGLDAVEQLLRAYEIEGRGEDLQLARGIALAWLRSAGRRERAVPIWDDHITAIRAITLVRLWTYVRIGEAPASPFARRLLAALARHAERLAMPEFYRPEHNHGVTQAFALLALADALSPHPIATEWTSVARARLERQMEENVSPAGVHREHSPFYHFYVLAQFLDAARFARSRGAALSHGFEGRLRDMAEAGAHMLRPDGGLPALGDSDRGAPVLLALDDLAEPPLADAPAFAFAVSGGRRGRAPAARALVDPRGGMAFLRGGWGEREPYRDERHLAVRLGVFATTHVHRDLLSFEFAGYGEDLVVDSGGPYAYGDPLRDEYFVRTRAHNTVVVDGQDQRIAEARILRSAEWPGGHFLEADHEAYVGIRHRRAFALLPHGLLLVLDRLDADREFRAEALLHLSPRLAARVQDSVLVTERAGPGPTLRVHYRNAAPAAAAPALARGVVRPPQGWVATGDGAREETWTATLSVAGRKARFATLIVAEPAGRPRAGLELVVEGDPWDGGGAILVREAERTLTLRLPPHDPPTLEVRP